MSSDPVATFIARWAKATSAERANYSLFLTELCDLLGVPRPDPATDDTSKNAYVFERAVTFHQRDGKTTTGRIDLYKRGCFVLEAKQYAAAKTAPAELSLDLDGSAHKSSRIARGTAAWDRAMIEALGQAEGYARALPVDEDPPPFLLVVDVGHVFELYTDFTQKGKNYLPFPDAHTHRHKLAELADPGFRDLLRAIWLAPHSLDPAKKSAAVTREVAGYLAELAKSFEQHHDPKLVAEFLSRCLFCMFAEDVGLLPKESFHQLLDSVKADPGSFVPLMEMLFEDMNHGRFSGLLRKKLLYFNGGLFASARALPVSAAQLDLLRKAASLEWRHVEPAIFGTLLERALHPEERHKLGAHYTPRAYVERLVLPTVMEPLREEWAAVRIAAVTLAQRDTAADLKNARATVRAFHDRLCAIRVLDPACGSGNFLYVALEQMKRLEGEVIALLHDLGDTGTLNLQGSTVDPHQFLGLEINPRAAAIAELVLWIGYLQWHFRVHGDAMPAEPVLKKFNNIECRDAVLAYDKHAFAQDPATGKTRFVWDRKSTKTDPVTGREVPDESRVRPLDTYENPRPAPWPQADFIVGNPPFLGTKRMRDDLGDGYVETLRETYSAQVEDNADFVMYWWHKAAEETLSGRCRRFGLITTNSIRQAFNRRVVHQALEAGLSLRFAIPDHPWVDTADGAAVRIAMTVGARTYALPEKGVLEEPPPDPSELPGDLYLVQSETSVEDGSAEITLAHLRGRIGSGLSIGAELEGMNALQAGEGVCGLGVALHGSGFLLEPDDAREMRKHGASVIKPYLGGGDLLRPKRERYIIDFSFLTEEQARKANPNAFERVVTHVRPERIVNRRETIKKLWWRFGWERPEIRKAMVGLNRFIATTETAKHRVFQFLDGSILPDHMVIVVASDDAFHLGVLSSRIHVVYALAAGGTLEDRPRYNKSRCFDPFPFPDCTEKQKEKIRKLAEELDAHRKRAQEKHKLGLTDIYNVLEKLRAATPETPASSSAPATPLGTPTSPSASVSPLTPKERAIHDAALVSTLKQLHDELDAAVADAYGWPWPLADAEILERVVALNAARAAEEAKGQIRWLRPEYQNQLSEARGRKPVQSALALDDSAGGRAAVPAGSKKQKATPAKSKKTAWPKTLAERIKAVESALTAAEQPLTASELAKAFARAKAEDVQEILESLVTLGHARPGDKKGTFVR